jgi:putative inorganic carbon (HCO3(-)) transporter
MRSTLRRTCALVADHEIYPLALGVAIATFSARWAPLGLGLIAALWLVRWLGRGTPTVRTPLEWPVVLMLLMVPVTFYATTDRPVTFVQVSRLLAGLALAYGLANWARRGAHIALLALALSGVGLGLALFGLISVDWQPGGTLPLVPRQIYSILPTLVRDTVHHNIMAGALLMLLPFPITMLLPDCGVLPSVVRTVPQLAARLLDARWLRALLYAAATLSMLGVLVLTKSRGGWVAGGVVVLVVLVRRWRVLLWLIPVALGALTGLAWWGDLPSLIDALGSVDALSGWEGRVELWSRALCMIQDFPFTGIGAGTFDVVVDALYPLFLAGPDVEIPHAHNLLLQVGVDLGIPGLVGFVAIVLLALWSAVESAGFYRRAGREALAALAWAGMASLVGMLVHGLVDAAIWVGGRSAFVPWAVIGAIVALGNRPEVDRQDSEGRLAAPPEGRAARLRWVAGLVLLLAAASAGGLHLLGGGRTPGQQPSVRLPLYPAAEGVAVRSEEPPADSGWSGPLEVATFTTTHPITEVVAFYFGTLAEAGWTTDSEAGDRTSWGGIYTRQGRRSVCFVDVFSIDSAVWSSIMCGDRTEPVDASGPSPLPTAPPTPGSPDR